MKLTASLAAILSLTQMCLGQDLIYTASPGFQTHNQHQDVTLSWRVSTTGVGLRFWNIYLYQGNKCRISMFAGIVQDCDGTRQGLFSINDTHVDYTVQNTSSGDAGQYTCAVNTGATFYNNSNAVLYIFDTPHIPLLSPSERSQEGNQFSLQCNATSTSLPTANRIQVNMVYIWCNNSEELDPGDLPERYSITSSGDPSNAVNDLLVITSLSRHDAGSYTCKAREDGSDFQSHFSNSYDLEPLYAPGHASPGGYQTVVTGDDVILSCSADDLGRPDGSWIWMTPQDAVVNTSDAGQLAITNVTVTNDDGEYSCRLTNFVGDGARGYVTVIVQEMPLLVVIEDVSLTITESLNVSCEAKARPQCDVTWKYANGSNLPPSVFTWKSSPRSDGKYTMTTSYLQWTAGSSPDDRRHKGGGINCVASNVVGDTTTDFILDVQFASYNVQVNSSTEIMEYERLGPVLCSAVCNPPCTYSWYKGGARVSSNAELIKHNVTRDDHGVYECRPDNSIPGGQTAHFDLTIFYGPFVDSFDVITPAGPINQNDDVTFLCQTDSRPLPIITLIGPSGGKLVTSSTSNILEHTLTDIDCLDSGAYRCVVSNALTGRQRSTLLPMTVRCPPRKYSTSDTRIAAAEGGSVTFSITVVAFPDPVFTWIKRHKEEIPQAVGSAQCGSDICISSSLIVPHITQEEFGNYSVTASNPLGVMVDVVFFLTAAEKPDVPSKLRVRHANALSITMQWTSGWNRGDEQVFTLMYRRSDSDESFTSITDISDPGRGETVTSKVVGLLPGTSYDVTVLTTNQFGGVQTKLISASSATEPQLNTDGSLSLTITGDRAIIKWFLHSYRGPITHVDVNSCDVSSARCFITTVMNITSAVEVAVPEGGSSYSFVFRVYDGEDLLLNVNHVIKLDTGPSTSLVVGVVVAVVLLCAVAAAIIGIIIWRRRGVVKAKSGNQTHSRQIDPRHSNSDINYENTSIERDISATKNNLIQQELSPYEQIEDSAHATLSKPGVYERPQAAQSVEVPAVYATLHLDDIDSNPTAGQSDKLELSEYANMA